MGALLYYKRIRIWVFPVTKQSTVTFGIFTAGFLTISVFKDVTSCCLLDSEDEDNTDKRRLTTGTRSEKWVVGGISSSCEHVLTQTLIVYACNETNLMHYLFSVYSVTIPPHVLGLLVAHHQEVTMYICNNWYVLNVLVDCRRAWLRTTSHDFPTVPDSWHR
jgi:hypothetical protein